MFDDGVRLLLNYCWLLDHSWLLDDCWLLLDNWLLDNRLSRLLDHRLLGLVGFQNHTVVVRLLVWLVSLLRMGNSLLPICSSHHNSHLSSHLNKAKCHHSQLTFL